MFFRSHKSHRSAGDSSHSSIRLLWEWIRWTELLNAQFRQPLTHVDACLERLLLDNARYKSTRKRITSTVCVVDQLFRNGVDRVLLHTVFAFNSHYGGVCALCDDDRPLAFRVLLWQGSHGSGNLGYGLCIEIVGFGV